MSKQTIFLSAMHKQFHDDMMAQALAYADATNVTYEVLDEITPVTQNKPVSGVFYDKTYGIDDSDLKAGIRNATPVML